MESKFTVEEVSYIKSLKEKTGMSIQDAKKAYEYAGWDEKLAIAYFKAKSLAVATPGRTFDQRVQMFLENS